MSVTDRSYVRSKWERYVWEGCVSMISPLPLWNYIVLEPRVSLSIFIPSALPISSAVDYFVPGFNWPVCWVCPPLLFIIWVVLWLFPKQLLPIWDRGCFWTIFSWVCYRSLRSLGPSPSTWLCTSLGEGYEFDCFSLLVTVHGDGDIYIYW